MTMSNSRVLAIGPTHLTGFALFDKATNAVVVAGFPTRKDARTGALRMGYVFDHTVFGFVRTVAGIAQAALLAGLTPDQRKLVVELWQARFHPWIGTQPQDEAPRDLTGFVVLFAPDAYAAASLMERGLVEAVTSLHTLTHYRLTLAGLLVGEAYARQQVL